MTDCFPDIEIYIKDVNLSEITTWLCGVFDEIDVTSDRHKSAIELTLNDTTITAIFIPGAVENGFSSLWFNSDKTPWQTDRDCALAAWSALKKEIRCSDGSWDQQENTDQQDNWICFNQLGESEIVWQS